MQNRNKRQSSQKLKEKEKGGNTGKRQKEHNKLWEQKCNSPNFNGIEKFVT